MARILNGLKISQNIMAFSQHGGVNIRLPSNTSSLGEKKLSSSLRE